MTSPDVLERLQAEHRYQKRLADQIQVTASYDSAARKRVEMLSDAIAEIERLRASHGPVCQHSWHKLAIVTGCGNETDSVGAFCQFCGGKVEAV